MANGWPAPSPDCEAEERDKSSIPEPSATAHRSQYSIKKMGQYRLLANLLDAEYTRTRDGVVSKPVAREPRMPLVDNHVTKQFKRLPGVDYVDDDEDDDDDNDAEAEGPKFYKALAKTNTG